MVCCLSCGSLCGFACGFGVRSRSSKVRRNSAHKIHHCQKSPKMLRSEIQRGIIQTSPFEEQRFRCLKGPPKLLSGESYCFIEEYGATLHGVGRIPLRKNFASELLAPKVSKKWNWRGQVADRSPPLHPPCTRQARRLLFRRFALVASSLSLESGSRPNPLIPSRQSPNPRRHRIRDTLCSPALAQSVLLSMSQQALFIFASRGPSLGIPAFPSPRSEAASDNSQLGSLHNSRLLGLLSLRRRPYRLAAIRTRRVQEQLQPRPVLGGLFLPDGQRVGS